ncbi:Flp family type IVb pilin [Nocardioides pacificus]
MVELLKILVDARKARMDERGASAVEYGLLVAAIAAAVVIAVFFMGNAIKDLFSDTCAEVASGANCTTPPTP